MNFKNGAATDLCLLCSAGSENRVHFTAECSALSSVRQSYISVLNTILLASNSLLTVKSVINDKFLFTHLILDCTSDTIASTVLLCPQECHRVESVSRHLCFALHFKRCKLNRSASVD